MRKFKKIASREGLQFCSLVTHKSSKIKYKLHECSNIEGDKNSDLTAAERKIQTNYALLPYNVWDKAKKYWFNINYMWPLKSIWEELTVTKFVAGKEN